MQTAIILHGMPEEAAYKDATKEAQSNCHWLPWLQQQLVAEGILAQTPELPCAYKPDYEQWKNVFEQFVVNEDSILVGHSCGAGFLVRWLSEGASAVDTLVLVAPWMDPHQTLPGFFDFKIEKTVPERVGSIHIFISDDDDEEMHEAVRQITEAWPAAVAHRLTGQGHFTLTDMGTRVFPELRTVLLP